MKTIIYTGYEAVRVIDHIHSEGMAEQISYWFPEVSFARGISIPVHPADLIENLCETEFLIEQTFCTLSEHVFLWFQKQIRDGVIKPEGVQIFYVDTPGDAWRIPLDKEGDIEDWPGGFFRERLELLR